MASPLAQATQSAAERAAARRRAARVQYYAAPRAPARRRQGGTRTPTPTPPPVPGSRLSDLVQQFSSTTEAQRQAQEQAPEQKPEGFWGSDFGQGLGYVINNPVTRVVSAPLNYFQTGGRAVTLGVEEAAEAAADLPPWARYLIGEVPGAGNLLRGIDTERTEADTRSNVEKVFSPHTTYGGGELLYEPENPTGAQQWMNRITGLGLDVAFDPLTYVGGGASRVVTQAAPRSVQAADDLARATRAAEEAQVAAREALEAATRTGTRTQATDDAIDAATAARKELDRATAASENAAGFPAQQDWEIPLPRNRAERANLAGELSKTPEGRRFLTEMPGEARRGGVRGFQVMSPEAKALLRIQDPGLRLRGFGTKIPGTGGIANAINQGGGQLRRGLAAMPRVGQGAGRVSNIRVPRGLEKDYAILTRDKPGDLLLAATHVNSRNDIRIGSGALASRNNRTLTNMLRKVKKSVGGDKDEIRRLVDEAETSPEMNDINRIPAQMLENYQQVTGRILDPNYLRDPATYFPHLMAGKWRRTLSTARKRGDQAQIDFLNHAGIVDEELLEDAAFYTDNLIDGSGFLEKARVFGPDPVTGEPRTFKFGDKEVTFSEPGVSHVNEQLHEAFPSWQGDFYETDPATVFEAYNTSLARQAGRDLARQRLAASANPFATVVEGEVEEARQAMNTALEAQGGGPGPILSTAQGRYDPTQPLPAIPETPLVPGSAEDRARRAAVEAAQTSARGATVPEEAAAYAAEAAVLPAAHPLGEVAEKYFVTTKGIKATQARDAAVTRAKTYARAAAKETNVAEAAVREALYDVKQNMISPLRTSIKELDAEITKANAAIRVYAKRVKELGSLSTETEEELTDLMLKVEQEIRNAETKLRRTAGTWKGKATRQQRKAEQKLRKTLDDLKIVRDKARANVREAPERMQKEFNERLEALDRPVREATEALLRAEVAVPVPHSQAAVEDARAVIESQIGSVPPEELRERYRGVLDDIRAGAENTKIVTDDPELVVLRSEYYDLLEQIKELRRRPRRRGDLSKANQKLLDEALAKRSQLQLRLGTAIRTQSPYELAQLEIVRMREELARYGDPTMEQRLSDVGIDSAVEANGGDGVPPQRLVREEVEGADPANVMTNARFSVNLAIGEMLRGDLSTEAFMRARDLVDALSDGDWLKFLGRVWNRLPRDLIAELEGRGFRSIGEDPSNIRRLRAQLANYEARFEPGGIFYDEQRARAIQTDMDRYEDDLAAATKNERDALARAEDQRKTRQEAIIWATPNKSARYTTRPGQPQNQLEQMGWRGRQRRYPESIGGGVGFEESTTPIPQRAAWATEDVIQDVVGGEVAPSGATSMPPSISERPRPVPTPRTEQEALDSLRNQLKYGSPTQQKLKLEAADAEAALRGRRDGHRRRSPRRRRRSSPRTPGWLTRNWGRSPSGPRPTRTWPRISATSRTWSTSASRPASCVTG